MFTSRSFRDSFGWRWSWISPWMVWGMGLLSHYVGLLGWCLGYHALDVPAKHLKMGIASMDNFIDSLTKPNHYNRWSWDRGVACITWMIYHRKCCSSSPAMFAEDMRDCFQKTLTQVQQSEEKKREEESNIVLDVQKLESRNKEIQQDLDQLNYTVRHRQEKVRMQENAVNKERSNLRQAENNYSDAHDKLETKRNAANISKPIGAVAYIGVGVGSIITAPFTAGTSLTALATLIGINVASAAGVVGVWIALEKNADAAKDVRDNCSRAVGRANDSLSEERDELRNAKTEERNCQEDLEDLNQQLRDTKQQSSQKRSEWMRAAKLQEQIRNCLPILNHLVSGGKVLVGEIRHQIKMGSLAKVEQVIYLFGEILENFRNEQHLEYLDYQQNKEKIEQIKTKLTTLRQSLTYKPSDYDSLDDFS